VAADAACRRTGNRELGGRASLDVASLVALIACILVIEKDRLEAGPVSIEEELVLGAVEELGALSTVAE